MKIGIGMNSTQHSKFPSVRATNRKQLGGQLSPFGSSSLVSGDEHTYNNHNRQPQHLSNQYKKSTVQVTLTSDDYPGATQTVNSTKNNLIGLVEEPRHLRRSSGVISGRQNKNAAPFYRMPGKARHSLGVEISKQRSGQIANMGVKYK